MPTTAQLDAVTPDDLRAAGSLKWADPDGVVGAFVAEMDYGVPPAVTEALRRYAETGPFGYLPAALEREMGVATAELLERRYGWSVAPENVRPAPDVLTIFEVVMQHLVPGTAVVIPTPAYMPFLLAPPLLGVEVVQVPMLRDDDGTFRYDLEGIDRAFAGGARLLMHCDPHNPTGRVFTRAELGALAEVVTRHDARVFADHVWAPLAFAGHRHVPYASVSAETARHTVTATSASKAWNAPGLKAAQAVLTADDDVRRWSDVGLLAEHATATPGVLAAIAAYREGEPWLADVLAYVQRNADAVRGFVARELPEVRMATAQGTYVSWLDLSAYDLGPDPAAYLRRHAGVQPTPGTACGEVGAGHVRLVHAMPHPVLLDVLERIGTALAGAPRR